MKLIEVLKNIINEVRIPHEVQRLADRGKLPIQTAISLAKQVDSMLSQVNQTLEPLYSSRDFNKRPLIDKLPEVGWISYKYPKPVQTQYGLITHGAFIVKRFGFGFKLVTFLTNIDPNNGEPMLDSDGTPLKKNGKQVEGVPMTMMYNQIQNLLNHLRKMR